VHQVNGTGAASVARAGYGTDEASEFTLPGGAASGGRRRAPRDGPTPAEIEDGFKEF